jgi:multidrug resistance efflux pump
MVAALMGLYFGAIWLIFNKMGIAWTKNRTIGVVLAGCVVLMILILGWHISAPTVNDGAIVTSPVIQMRTDVGGRVVKVWVTTQREVKKGEPLFQINPEKYEFELGLATAQLAQAKRDVEALGASLEAALAAEDQSKAHIATLQSSVKATAAMAQSVRDKIDETRHLYDRARADVTKAIAQSNASNAEVEMVRGAFKTSAASKFQLTEAEKNAEAATAAVAGSKANAESVRVALEHTLPSQLKAAEADEEKSQRAVEEAKDAVKQAMAHAREVKIKLESTIDGEHTLIRQARENHAIAKWNFEHTTTYAPVNGRVETATLRPGDMVRALDRVMTIVSTEEYWVVAAVPQYLADFVAEGDPIDLTLSMYPGQVFTGKVERTIWASSAAQLSPSGELPDIRQIQEAGPFAVRIRLDPPPAEFPMRFGAVGTASIYTEYWKPFRLIQKMVINMQSWTNYFG